MENEDLELLSEEERAAIAEDDEPEDKKADESEDEDADGEAKAKADEGEASAETEAQEAAKAKEDEEKAAAEAAEKAKTDEEAAAKEKPAGPPPPFKLDAKSGKTVEELTEEVKRLDEQFEVGDITLSKYNADRAAALQAIWKIEMFDEINKQVAEQTVENRWKEAQQDFFSENREFFDNAILNAAYVHAVNKLISSDEGKGLSDRALLLKAREQVDEALGRTGRATDEGKVKDIDDEREKRKAVADAKRAEAERIKGKVTVGKMPAAKGADLEDRFDALDNLPGEEFEAAIAAMSDAERQAYERRG